VIFKSKQIFLEKKKKKEKEILYNLRRRFALIAKTKKTLKF
jgi:hypothetical protein